MPARPPATPLHPYLASVAPYPPGKPIEEVEREYGLKRVIKLASNENPLGPSPRAVKALAKAAKETNLYPDGGGYYLRRAIAAKHRAAPEEIILGAGSDEITTLIAAAWLGPGAGIATSEYSFVRYAMAARAVNAPVALAPMRAFRHDPAGLARAIGPRTRVVFIDNPGNPTGSMMTRKELAGLLKAIPRGVWVVLDEAYYEFAAGDPAYPNSDALRKKHPNLIVTRTFSKAYGLAGLRIGYAVAPREVIADLERVRAPFNTNRAAQAAALAALADRKHIARTVRCNETGKKFLGKLFASLGLGVTPTAANFLLVDFSQAGRSGAELYEALLRRGVIVRPMGGYGLPNHLRISIGTPEENRTLARALARVLS